MTRACNQTFADSRLICTCSPDCHFRVVITDDPFELTFRVSTVSILESVSLERCSCTASGMRLSILPDKRIILKIFLLNYFRDRPFGGFWPSGLAVA